MKKEDIINLVQEKTKKSVQRNNSLIGRSRPSQSSLDIDSFDNRNKKSQVRMTGFMIILILLISFSFTVIALEGTGYAQDSELSPEIPLEKSNLYPEIPPEDYLDGQIYYPEITENQPVENFKDDNFQTHDFTTTAFSDNGSAVQYVNDYGILNTTNAVYYLNESVSSNSTGFNITANNITLDCQGYQINYSSNDTFGYGIYNQGYNDTTIKNCKILLDSKSAPPYYRHYIELQKIYNCSIINNTILHRTAGYYHTTELRLVSSENCLIENNSFFNDDGSNCWTIYLLNSNNNIIRKNNFGFSATGGVYLGSSNGTLIDDNNLNSTSTTSPTGIYILNSFNATLTDNSFNFTFGKPIELSGTSPVFYNHTIGPDNRVKGKPVNYTFNTNDLVYENLNDDFGMIILAYSNNITVQNSNFTNGSLAFYESENLSIINNNLSGSNDNIYSYYANNILVKDNKINSDCGFYCRLISVNYGNNGSIINNTIFHNRTSYSWPKGIYSYNFNLIGILNNIIDISVGSYQKGGHAITLYDTSEANVSNNNITFISYAYPSFRVTDGIGIYLYLSNNTNIYNNNITSADSGTNSINIPKATGIVVYTSKNITIEKATIKTHPNTTSYGIYLGDDSSNITVKDSYIETKGEISSYGVYANTDIIDADFINTIINSTDVLDVYIDTDIDSGSFIEFINSTFNKSDVLINDSDFNMNVSYYLDVYVNYTNSSDASGVNITTWNNTGSFIFSELTNSSGNIARKTLLEYVQNSTDSVYQTNYTINSTANYTKILSLNLSSSQSIIFTMDVTPPNGSLITPYNDTYLANGSAVNFTANISDADEGLKNATLYVYDLSGNNWLDFDGSGDYVDVGNGFNYVNTSNFTISAWIKKEGEARTGIFRRHLGSYGYSFTINSDEKLWFFSADGGGGKIAKSTETVTLNQWTHIVAIYNSSAINHVDFYKNGVLLNMDNELTNNDMTSGGSITARIGIDYGTNYPFNGSIDEVRIYNRSLNSSEILEIYNSGLLRNSSLPNSSLVAWWDFEPSANLTRLVDVWEGTNNGTIINATWRSYYSSSRNLGSAVSYTLGIVVNLIDGIYRWFYKIFDMADNFLQTQNYTVTVDTTYPLIDFVSPTPSNNSIKKDITINVSVSDSNNVSAFIDWNNSLVLWMRMDDINSSGDPWDRSSYSNNGTAYGQASQTDDGYIGRGFEFDGDGDYVSITHSISINLTDNFTISMWLKGSSNQGSYYVPFSKQQYALYPGLLLQNTLFLIYNETSPIQDSSVSVGTYADDTWHHIICTKDRTNVSCYNNNILQDSDNFDGNSFNNTFPIRIGCFYVSGGGCFRNFNGTIDEVMIFNRALSQAEISALYANQSERYLEKTFTDLNDGANYSYTAYVQDRAGNINSTMQNVIGDTRPGFASVASTPAASNLDGLDPNVTIIIDANISDIDNNLDKVILQWKNATQTDWNNLTMANTTAKSYYTSLNESFNISYENNVTYQIWANDTEGKSNTSAETNLSLFWDCTWNYSETLADNIAGWDENKLVGNLTLNNTGDSQYSGGCELDFYLTWNLNILTSGSGLLVYYNNSVDVWWPTYTVAANSTSRIPINGSFQDKTTPYEDEVEFTIQDQNSESESSKGDLIRSFNATFITQQSGAYLTESLSSYPSFLYLTNDASAQTSTLFSGYLQNVMGNGSAINSAYNVSFNWTLPSEITNSTGCKNMFFSNISNSSLIYNNINVTFSSLASATTGVRSVYLYASGVNLTGSAIIDASNASLLTKQINITFLCYNASDSTCVTDCGYSQDPDCSQETTTTTVSGGGGGVTGGTVVKTKADYQLVRGLENKIRIPFKNPYANHSLTGLTFKVKGDIAKYIQVTPEKRDRLGPGQEMIITLTITSPTYIELGRQVLQVIIEGRKDIEFYKETKEIVVEIHEISSEEAEELVDESMDLMKQLADAGLSSEYLDELLNQSITGIQEFSYELIIENYGIIKKQVGQALEAKQILNELDALIKLAQEKGIDSSVSTRLSKLAKLSLERGEFEQALERAKEAQITYALEVKGELGSLIYYLIKYPREVSLSVLALFLLSFGTYKISKLQLLKRKIKQVKEEQVILNQLIGIVQKECFKEKKMSMDEYQTAMKAYNTKLSKAIERHIELENKRLHMLKFTKKNKRLSKERANIVRMIKELQEDYLKKGKIETRTYELKLESYNKRVSEIDEALATLEAKQAFKKGFGLFKLLKTPKRRFMKL